MKRYSVALDTAAKTKIRHHLNQLKELAGKLEIPTRKREAIISKILALEEEVERGRTRFEVIAALILDGATVAGEAGERLEPWRKWLDSIARIAGLAKDSEAAPASLPPPPEPRKIEPPRKQTPRPPPPPPSSDFNDDDIPF